MLYRKFLHFTPLLLILVVLSTVCYPQRPKGNITRPLGERLPKRPNSPTDLRVIKRGADHLTLGFTDISENELGNRLYRSNDGTNWQLLGELGTIGHRRSFEYKDSALEKTKLYYYRVEVYGRPEPVRRTDPIISSFTAPLPAYTGEGDSISLFRVQVEIKTANVANASLDATLRVDVGLNRGRRIIENSFIYLDYGHDDFERGQSFRYDLNFKDVNTLDELGDIKISNTSYTDIHIIESVKIIANNFIVYEKDFGAAGHKLPGLGTLNLPFSDLASSSNWQTMLDSSRKSVVPVGLDFFVFDQTLASWAVRIPKAELISRIESIVGHSLHAVPKLTDNVTWQENAHAVETSYIDSNTLRVDLDLRTTTGINRNLDIDLDLRLSFSCDTTTGNLTLFIQPANMRTSHSYDFLNGLPDFLNILLKHVYDYVARRNSGDEFGTIEIKAKIPGCFDCKNVKCQFSPEGDLLIILGFLDCN